MAYWPPSCILIAFTLILLQSSSITAQNGGKLTVGQSLTAATSNGSLLLSPSGDFAFGFHQLPNNNNLFLLAIWYAKIPDTIVWYANETNPVNLGSSVTITANEGLFLSDPQGTPLWNTADKLSGGRTVNYGFMNDTGNFMLKSSDTDDAAWESFDHPTDTLLPTQNFEKGVLNTRDLETGFAYHPSYQSYTGNQTNPENAGDSVIYSESGDLYIEIKNGSRFDLTPASILVSDKTNYQRVTLDFDGVLRWYNHPKIFAANKVVNWSSVKSLPDNICASTAITPGSGTCGYNSICSIGEDNRLRCDCPPYYSLMDPNDTYSSCKPNFPQYDCDEYGQGATKNGYQLKQLQNIDWPSSDYANLQTITEDDCKSSCQNDCFCAVAIFSKDGQTCWKKRLPLSNGRNYGGVNRIVWLKTHHKNLVRFIGFCKEEDPRLLVYEYMSNGTVADYLFGDLRPSWTARIQIAQGIARGLLYLHEECSTQIIHCDIKPQNILLDDYYNARISDFGLAKLLILNQTHTNTAIRGTKEYVAPEWFRNKPVTIKVDVYSFGVLLLEIICCRRSVCMDISEEGAILTDWAFDCFQSNTLAYLVDGDTEALNDTLHLERYVMVALWCIQEDPSLRRTMKRVIQMLEGMAEVASPPCPTSFTVTTQP
uniref:Non-specific serine/threonine protein kinase n=1 Tax=Chenopodium quinoa TaxID=63459 RepID=A0A803KM02_CHEQI